jgi:hypothetical protein
MRPIRHLILTAICAAMLCACGGGGAGGSATSATGASTDLDAADVTVLMMGNSHTTVAGLPAQLAAVLQAGLPGQRVAVVAAPSSMFLDEHLHHAPTMALLRSRPWTAVVLQAQKYSSSGQFVYSTLEAEQLVQAARLQRAVPVMFPEWPRLTVPETQRVYDLHVGIAQAQPACVAPIGQAWDLARQRHPELRLHASDGNHADPAGAYLTALMLYAAATGRSPAALPDVAVATPPADQARLRAVAADTLALISARLHCPADRPL